MQEKNVGRMEKKQKQARTRTAARLYAMRRAKALMAGAGMCAIKKPAQSCSESRLRHGYIRTLSGKYRRLESYRDYYDGSMGRVAVNTIVQGGAADYLKLCMVRARKRFKGTGIKMIMQVHDELVFDCPDEHVDFATREVKSIMETSHRFSVPIIADPGKGRSWLEAK